MTDRLFSDRPARSTRTAAILVIAIGGFLAVIPLMALIWSLIGPQQERGRTIGAGVAGLAAAWAFVFSGWFLQRRHGWAWWSSLVLLAMLVLGAVWLGIRGATEPEGDGQLYAAAGAIQAIAVGIFGIVELLKGQTRADVKQRPLSGRIPPLPLREPPPPPPPAQN